MASKTAVFPQPFFATMTVKFGSNAIGLSILRKHRKLDISNFVKHSRLSLIVYSLKNLLISSTSNPCH